MKRKRFTRGRGGRTTGPDWYSIPSVWQSTQAIAVASGLNLFEFAGITPVDLNADPPVVPTKLILTGLHGYLDFPIATAGGVYGIAAGFYIAEYDDQVPGFQTQNPALSRDAAKDNWLSLQSRNWAILPVTAILPGTTQPHYHFRLPRVTIGQGQGLFLAVNVPSGIVGASVNFSLNFRWKVQRVA